MYINIWRHALVNIFKFLNNVRNTVIFTKHPYGSKKYLRSVAITQFFFSTIYVRSFSIKDKTEIMLKLG